MCIHYGPLVKCKYSRIARCDLKNCHLKEYLFIIFNVIDKTKLAIFAFLYFGKFMKNSIAWTPILAR